VRAIRRMGPGQSRPQGGRGVSRNRGRTRISGEIHPSHGTKCKGIWAPKCDHVERSDLAKRFFIAEWERERAESQER
jgi:hypothetical protein